MTGSHEMARAYVEEAVRRLLREHEEELGVKSTAP